MVLKVRLFVLFGYEEIIKDIVKRVSVKIIEEAA